MRMGSLKKEGLLFKGENHSLVGRRGKKRALIAVGHKILMASYHMLKNGVSYNELGGDYLDKRRKEKITKSYVKRLASLGCQVTLSEVA